MPEPWGMRTCVRVNQGSPYARFRRTLETRKLSVVLMAASEIGHVRLDDDALEILILMAEERDARFGAPLHAGSAGF
jgi:hypothetical protein